MNVTLCFWSSEHKEITFPREFTSVYPIFPWGNNQKQVKSGGLKKYI